MNSSKIINAMEPKITIDVVSDVACPWCYIGKKRLENALKQHGVEAEVHYLPFQLDPAIPAEGMDRQEYFENKFGSESRIESMFNRVESVGEGVGIAFRFREIPKIPNTLKLHMLLNKAAEEGFQKELAAELFEKYMVHPEDLTAIPTLVGLMKSYGWEESKTLEVLSNETLRYEVTQQIKQLQQTGISGVPFFIVNKKYGISGAQPEEVWEEVFQSLQVLPKKGDSCDVENGNC